MQILKETNQKELDYLINEFTLFRQSEGSKGKYIDLRGANLMGADLKNKDLSRTSLVGAILVNADLRGANLSGTNIAGAFFFNAKYDGNTNLGDIDPQKEKMVKMD